MRKLTLVLAASTLTFAASTVYFAMEARHLRQQPPMPAVPAVSVSPGNPITSEQAATVQAAPETAPDAAKPGDAPPHVDPSAAMRAHAVGQIPRLRRILENPQLREKHRREIAESRARYLVETGWQVPVQAGNSKRGRAPRHDGRWLVSQWPGATVCG